MTQIEKLRDRLRAARVESSFSDLRRLLEHYGWSLASQRGSHVTFTKPGALRIGFPLVSGRSVKQPYVVKVLKRLGVWE